MSKKLSERAKKSKIKEVQEAAIETYRHTLIERILALTQRFGFFDGLSCPMGRLAFLYVLVYNVHKIVLKRKLMDFYRVQDKIISWQRVEKTLRKALLMRSRGFSQQDAATRLGIDRTLISRVESIGELRKGQSVACLGFPILNKEEITEILQKEGVDFIMLMSEKERLDFVEQRSGKELINEIMDLTARVRGYEVVVCIASDERLRMLEGMLDGQVIGLEIGESPLTEDKWVDPQEIRNIMKSIKAARRA